MIMCFVTWGVLLYWRPYETRGDELVACAAQLSLFVTLASSLILKSSADSPALDATLSVLLIFPAVLAVAAEAGLNEETFSTALTWSAKTRAGGTMSALAHRALKLVDRRQVQRQQRAPTLWSYRHSCTSVFRLSLECACCRSCLASPQAGDRGAHPPHR